LPRCKLQLVASAVSLHSGQYISQYLLVPLLSNLSLRQNLVSAWKASESKNDFIITSFGFVCVFMVAIRLASFPQAQGRQPFCKPPLILSLVSPHSPQYINQ